MNKILEIGDLMIGDWVIFHDSGYASDGTTWKEDRVCQIDAIDVDVRVKWHDEDGYKEDWPHVSTFCLSPIPLTSEILEKNGLEWRGNCGMFKEDTDYYLELLKEDDIIWWSVNWAEYTLIPIHYVHQLQQALRLCGINHEIIL